MRADQGPKHPTQSRQSSSLSGLGFKVAGNLGKGGSGTFGESGDLTVGQRDGGMRGERGRTILSLRKVFFFF